MCRNRFPGSMALLALVVVALVLALPPVRPAANAQSNLDEPAMGTVLRGQLLVRGAPNVADTVIGRVAYGQRVVILSETPGWLEIVYPPDSDGSGWVSAHYVQIDGSGVPNLPEAPATATSAAVAAPSLAGFSQPATFRWRWSGTVPADIDWRFDILVFQRNAAHPYKTIQVDPAEVEPDGDTYTKVADRFAMQCSSYWTVRVSQYVEGRFRMFLSESSNRQEIGVPCPAPIPVEPRPRPGQPQIPGGAGSGNTGSGGERSPGGSAPQPTAALPGTGDPAGLTPEPTALPSGSWSRPGGVPLVRPGMTPDVHARGLHR